MSSSEENTRRGKILSRWVRRSERAKRSRNWKAEPDSTSSSEEFDEFIPNTDDEGQDPPDPEIDPDGYYKYLKGKLRAYNNPAQGLSSSKKVEPKSTTSTTIQQQPSPAWPMRPMRLPFFYCTPTVVLFKGTMPTSPPQDSLMNDENLVAPETPNHIIWSADRSRERNPKFGVSNLDSPSPSPPSDNYDSDETRST
ncbi:uncharacterized protein [Spinacia oleracea]|uniref:Uncharacterized protein n=1 Tax=Spinacia oleracea TaxID=3562 RepID=A0ABM3QN93_SPIOL|nr:uncharacterized protein LOC130461000 [Spinacia oleracea]